MTLSDCGIKTDSNKVPIKVRTIKWNEKSGNAEKQRTEKC